MSEREHTLGPWSPDKVVGNFIIGANGKVVGCVPKGPDNDLVCASPGLLAAAEKALACIDCSFSLSEIQAPVESCECHACEVAAMLQTEITKAKGQA